MIAIPSMSGHRVAVLGLGKSGLAAARALIHSKAHVLAWDDNQESRDRAKAEDVPLADLMGEDFSTITALVLSPGIPHNFPEPHEVVTRARAAGCGIIGETELLSRADTGAAFIGVTGTNGKSTTTALIGHILHQAGRNAQTGGNLGVPSVALEPAGPGGYYVLEMSSYQLELVSTLVFDIAVLLNISPDHMDRHGGLAGYRGAKERVFAGQGTSHTAVVGIDDCHSRGLFESLKSRDGALTIPVSGADKAAGGVYVEDGWLVNDIEGREERVMEMATATALPGSHNAQNAAAAFAATRAAGLAMPQIRDAIHSFPGLPHRQELVARIDGVAFINDSKATNAAATARALDCYHNILWIAGGRAKEGGIEALTPYFNRIRHAFLTGEAADDFARTLEGQVEMTLCGDLETAFAGACDMALSESGSEPETDSDATPTVLFSPACASFDQWRDFEARGDAFRALAHKRAGTNDSGSTENNDLHHNEAAP
ncbi:MAG: UDP-N-acetylmuramoyl-L-alanine--D-glutamate ligase [Alphaproteobacteria bacterium]|nr:UDP-N-acetylmuramoyl-L-alanine--D-glutamate ligase [Alphaproteobacteria bacterium]